MRATSSTSASGSASRTAARAASSSRVARIARSGWLADSRCQRVDHLLGRLALAEHHLGVTGAAGAVDVQPRVPDVDEAGGVRTRTGSLEDTARGYVAGGAPA